MSKSSKSGLRPQVAVNLIRTITITLLSFVSFPFAAQALGDVAMGQYSWANTFVYYFLIIARLGIPMVAVRECAAVRDNKVELTRKVQAYFLLQLITTLISFTLLLIIVFSLEGSVIDKNMESLIMLLSLNFLAGVFSFEWVFIAYEQHFYIAIRTIIVTFITSLLVILFVTNDKHLYIYALIGCMSSLLTSIINLIALKRHGFSFKPVGNYDFKHILPPLIPVFLLTLVTTIYNQTDTFLLGLIDPSKQAVGSYSVGVRGIEIVITILTSLSAVFIPHATKAYEKHDLEEFRKINNFSLNIAFILGLPAIGLMIVLAPNIIDFIVFDKAYWDETSIKNAIIATSILASLMFTYSVSENIYQQVLLPIKKEKYYLFAMLIGVVLNISLSLLLGMVAFKDNPLLGVALATFISDLAVLVYMLIISRRYVLRNFFSLNNLKIFIATIIVTALAILVVPYLKLNPLVNVILTLLGAGVVYLLILLILREDLVMSFIKKEKSIAS
jgi:O-antigen/teichoic acid export membrane protein